jgi:hypothetical protein
MADFHRLVAPTYHGGLPGAYDYINDPANNTPPDPGAPAPADGKKGGTPPTSPNAGTYFIAFGEDARAENVNRVAQALAQNTDYLDDLLHRDLGAPYILEGLTASGITSSIVVPGDVYVGEPGTPDTAFHRNRLITIMGAGGAPPILPDPPTSQDNVKDVRIELIHNGSSVSVVGDGYFTNPTINIDPPLPDAADYTLVYFRRDNVSEQSEDILSRLNYQFPSYLPVVTALANAVLLDYPLPDWKDGTPNPSGAGYGVRTFVTSLLERLAFEVEGSARINSQSYNNATLGFSLSDDVSIYTQLTEIVDLFEDFLSRANRWTGETEWSSLGIFESALRVLGELQPRRNITQLGQNLLGSAPDALTPRIQNDLPPYATSALTLLWEAEADSGRKLRIYAQNTYPGFIITINARFDTTSGQWYYDDSGNKAARLDLNWGELTLNFVPSGVSEPFNFSAGGWIKDGGTSLNLHGTTYYDIHQRRIHNGRMQFSAVDDRVLNPHRNDYIEKNTLYAGNVPKAWGTIECANGSISPVSGMNFANAGLNTTDARVTFSYGLEDSIDNYYVVVAQVWSPNDSRDYFVITKSKSSMYFDLRVFELESGGGIGGIKDLGSATGTTFYIDFIVMGRQS